MEKQHKIEKISNHVSEIMTILGMDLKDDSLKDTPNRVSKMWVNELFAGLSEPPPPLKVFKNSMKYSQMLVEHNIIVTSVCEHHWQPITGYCHIGYIPDKYVIGLSKFHRIVRYYASFPQMQERLGMQIAKHLMKTVKTKHVAVVLQCEHGCCKNRGVRDNESFTSTADLHGMFTDSGVRAEFYNLLQMKLKK